MNRPPYLLLLATLALLGAGCAGLPPEASPVAPRAGTADPKVAGDGALPIDPQVTVGRLENGLTYYLRANSRPEARAELRLVVNAGSLQEDDDQQGLAHFVEHMAFNGTESFAKQELVDYIQSIGMRFGADLNAYTSFDETVYMLTVPTDQEELLDKGIQILSEWARRVSFEAEEIDNERGVVVEEWRLRLGAEARLQEKQFPVLFQGSRYARRLPIGEVEVLEGAPREALVRFYRDWYRPDLMAVVAVGDFDVGRLEARIREAFSGAWGPPEPRPRELAPVPDHRQTLYSIVTDPELTDTSVAVYYKLPKARQGSREEYRKSLVEGLYHSMLNDRLDEISRRPAAPFLYAVSSGGALVRSRDVYFQAAGVADGQVLEGLDALLTEAARVDRHGFTASELERAKKELLRFYEQAFRERGRHLSSTFAGEYTRSFLEGEPIPGIAYEVELVAEMVPSITLEELNELARTWISEENRVILVSGPEEAKADLPAEGELAATFRAIDGKTIAPYEDRVREDPLLAELPSAGSVTATVQVPEIGVTEWRLANGARVILKPTDFKNDQILLRGFSPGGTSLVADEDYFSAAVATALVAESGLGEFDQVELTKALAGKVVDLSPTLGELQESLQGAASPEDLETLLQLVYLHFTAPRADAEPFRSFLDRMRAFLAHRDADPSAVFSDRLATVLYRDHLRRRPLKLEQLEEMDLGRAHRVFRERFRNGGDFTFVLVGNFAVEAVRPLVETYLGGLPADGSRENWQDLGIRPAPGQTRVEVKKGLEPSARVLLRFHGDAPWSREQHQTLATLADILEDRLRTRLREELAATYGVSVSSNLSRRPRQVYSVSISFGCSPENVDRLIEDIFAEIAALKEQGARADELADVQKTQLRRRETAVQENPFWLAVLASYYSHGDDPRKILDYRSLVDSVTLEGVKDAAQRYFDAAQYVRAVLLPETGGDDGGAPVAAADR